MCYMVSGWLRLDQASTGREDDLLDTTADIQVRLIDRREDMDPVWAAWERLAEICERYLSKGDRVYVEGRIEYRQWEGQDGQTRYTTEIRAREMIMLGGRGDAGSTAARGTRPEAGRESEDDDYSDFSNEALMGEDDLPF